MRTRVPGYDRHASCAATLAFAALMLAVAVPSPASAQSTDDNDPWAGIVPQDPAPTPDAEPQTAAQPPSPEPVDWSALNLDSAALTESPSNRVLRARTNKLPPAKDFSLTSNHNADGSGAVNVRQNVTPWWDTRVGVDLNVANSGSQLPGVVGVPTAQSNGTAWAAATAPGLGVIWDKTTLEARLDPFSDQARFGTAISKSIPIWGDKYSLTLQNGYNVVQPAATREARSFQTDSSAKFTIADTGTSFIAGQTLSSTDDHWLGRIGAEQKLFGDVTVSGTVSRLADGDLNKTISAGYKKTW